jgi:hypothetical protein
MGELHRNKLDVVWLMRPTCGESGASAGVLRRGSDLAEVLSTVHAAQAATCPICRLHPNMEDARSTGTACVVPVEGTVG